MCDAPGRGSVTTSMIKIIIEAFAAAGRPRGLHVFLARIERLGTAGEDFCCWGRCNILLHMASQQGQPPTEKLLVPARIIGRCHHTSPPGGCKESVQRDSSRGCGVALMLLKPLNPGNPQTLLLLLSTLLSEWPMHCKQFGGLTADSTVASIPIVPLLWLPGCTVYSFVENQAPAFFNSERELVLSNIHTEIDVTSVVNIK